MLVWSEFLRRLPSNFYGILTPAFLGYGVIGSPADSGSVSLGSSPGTPAKDCTKVLHMY
jgi:hypothetical protein